MADNVTFQTATPATPPSATVVSTEEITTLNGGAVTAQHAQRAILAVRTADGVAVDVTNATPLPVVQTGTPALPTGASTEATLAAQSAKLPATLGQKAMAASLAVALASDQSAVPVSGNVGLLPATSGGLSLYRAIDAGVTGANPKGSAGQLYGYYISNNATAARFVKIYDKAGAPTSGDTPVMTLQLPAGAAANVGFANGIAFANGIGVRATTGVADADTGAPSTNDVILNIWYK